MTRTFLIAFVTLLHSILSVAQNNDSDFLFSSVKTKHNNTINCYVKGDEGKKILLIGCMHGNEKAGIAIAQEVLNRVLKIAKTPNTLICIPTLNPDGNILNVRTNASKVDLNRNFPSSNWEYIDSAKLAVPKKKFWGGKIPASEIETKFIVDIEEQLKPDAIIILHQFMDCVQYDGTGHRLAIFISNSSKQKLLDNIGYPTSGSIGSYFGSDRNREVVTIEIPKNPSINLTQSITNALVDIVVVGY
jgi:protein MpaA